MQNNHQQISNEPALRADRTRNWLIPSLKPRTRASPSHLVSDSAPSTDRAGLKASTLRVNFLLPRSRRCVGGSSYGMPGRSYNMIDGTAQLYQSHRVPTTPTLSQAR